MFDVSPFDHVLVMDFMTDSTWSLAPDVQTRTDGWFLTALSLCHDHTHLVDAEGSEGGGQQAGGTQKYHQLKRPKETPLTMQ